MLTGAEQDRGNGEVELVHELSFEILADGADTAEQADVFVAGRGFCFFESYRAVRTIVIEPV